MARRKSSDELFERLRANGLRKRTASLLSRSTDRRRKPAKAVQQTLAELKRVVGEAEDRISGGPSKRKASAKKGAATRKRNAQRLSDAAKKGARTRAKSR
jgi:hypothetical protein